MTERGGESVVGRGGMAVVSRARRNLADGSQCWVALKSAHKHYRDDSDVLDRLKREAALCATLHHSNVIKVFGYEERDGEPAIVMEYVEGFSLGELWERQPLTMEVLRLVFNGVMKGLQHIHSRGVIHRDVSPGNILLSKTGEVRLIDLGLARMLAEPKTSGTFKGTPPYASLEALHCGELDFSSDLYSVGAVFYQALTGRTPYGVGDYMELRERHRKNEIHPLPSMVPSDFRSVIISMLQPHSQRPFHSVSDVWAEWDQYDDEVAEPEELAAIVERAMNLRAEAVREVAAGSERGSISRPKGEAVSDPNRETVKVQTVDAFVAAHIRAMRGDVDGPLEGDVSASPAAGAELDETRKPDEKPCERSPEASIGPDEGASEPSQTATRRPRLLRCALQWIGALALVAALPIFHGALCPSSNHVAVPATSKSVTVPAERSSFAVSDGAAEIRPVPAAVRPVEVPKPHNPQRARSKSKRRNTTPSLGTPRRSIQTPSPPPGASKPSPASTPQSPCAVFVVAGGCPIPEAELPPSFAVRGDSD